MQISRFCSLLLMVITLLPQAAKAGEITVAAASDLTFALTDIAHRFEQKTGNQAKLAFGSSGNFFAQIQNGAAFDVFFSADVEYPRKLAASGLAAAPTLWVYGTGRIVLWAPAGSPLDLGKMGMKALLDPSVQRIAIANPAHAPYGRAAKAALESFKLYDKVRDKLVLGENISQTAQFVASGNAQIGILALSLACAPTLKDKGTYWEIPVDSYPLLEQAAIIPTAARDKTLARAFVDYVRTPQAQAILQQYGFKPPEKP
jgi:molybdate transport system substrate-binding protein